MQYAQFSKYKITFLFLRAGFFVFGFHPAHADYYISTSTLQFLYHFNLPASSTNSTSSSWDAQLAAAEICSSTTKAFTLTGDMNEARYPHGDAPPERTSSHRGRIFQRDGGTLHAELGRAHVDTEVPDE